MKGRNTKFEDALLRERIQAKIDSGELKESGHLSSALNMEQFDSLETVELTMALEESPQWGVEIKPLRDVLDLSRLLKTSEFQEQRRNRLRD